MRADKPMRSNLAGARIYKCGITGTGAATPTKRYGPGITVTRTAVGVFRYTFASHPGTLLGVKLGAPGADTMSAVKGYSVSRGAQVLPTGGALGYVDVSLWDSSNAAVELAALQYLDLDFEFTELKSDLVP